MDAREVRGRGCVEDIASLYRGKKDSLRFPMCETAGRAIGAVSEGSILCWMSSSRKSVDLPFIRPLS